MSRIALLLVALSAAKGFQSHSSSPGGSAADLAKTIREKGLDPAECYRVRDLSFVKDDIKLYFNDGYLTFSKPVLGQRLSAVFSTDVEGGDGEAIVIPPSRSERQSLAGFTQSPNLDEHFRAVLMIATEGSVERLLQSVEHEESAKKAPEMGAVLAEQWGPVVGNISGPMQMRLVEDLWSTRSRETGMVFFAVSGKTLGNFDILSDSRANHRMMVRQHVEREGHDDFNVWTDFIPRQFSRERYAGGAAPVQEFKLSHYRIDTEIASDLSVKAVTRVTLRTGHDAVRVFPFEMARAMQVSAVRIDGAPAELMRDDSQRGRITGNGEEFEFLVVAPSDLAPESEHEFEFEHQGNVIATRGDGVYFVSARGSWYPHMAGQFATFDLMFRYPKRLTLVAGGDAVEDRVDGDWRFARRNMTVAVAAAGFNLGVYEKVAGTVAGVNYEVYGNRNLEQALRPPVMFSTPDASAAPNGLMRPRGTRPADMPVPVPISPDPLARLRTVAGDVAASLEFFSGLFGPPVMKTLTVAPIPGTFGQGFPGLVYLSTFAYIDPLSRPAALRSAREQVFFSDLMVPHEVAHQWWGSIIESRRIEDEWLLEALANYSSLLWLEKKKSVKEMASVLESYRTELLSKDADGAVYEAAGPITWGERLPGWPNSGAWRVISYGKGTWILHMLRRRMGDDAFFKLLAELRRRYEFKSVTTADFMALAREIRPKGMAPEVIDTFFDNWVFSTGIPALKLRYSVKGVAPAVKLSGTVGLSGASDDFALDTPVEVQFAKGPPQTIWVRTAGDERNFTANLRQIPARVVIPDEVLKK
ncbi:MAG TPA: M1 family aminopeptidase [Bryobacteraceae bacterium]|nr:M1 family aminopeptidase [Bryobacteraceae bacterium]